MDVRRQAPDEKLMPSETLYPTAALQRENTGALFSWQNHANIKVDDADYARCNMTSGPSDSQFLIGKTFASSVPDGATIDGYVVELDRRGAVGNISDTGLSLGEDDPGTPKWTPLSENRGDLTTWPSSFAEKSYGGASDTWATSFTPAEVRDAEWGVSLAVTNNNVTQSNAFVNFIRITIYWTVPSTGQPFILQNNRVLPAFGGINSHQV